MKKLRDGMILLAVTAAFAVSLALFREAVGIASAWFSLMVMLTFLGVIAFARPLFVLKLPAFLRRPREWEKRGALYRMLGVAQFGALLRRTPLRILNSAVYFKEGADPSVLQAQIESAEAAHIIAGALLVPFMAFACVRGLWGALSWLLIVQIGFNVYPVMHLRSTRLRVDRLHSRMRSTRRATAARVCESRV